MSRSACSSLQLVGRGDGERTGGGQGGFGCHPVPVPLMHITTITTAQAGRITDMSAKLRVARSSGLFERDLCPPPVAGVVAVIRLERLIGSSGRGRGLQLRSSEFTLQLSEEEGEWN